MKSKIPSTPEDIYFAAVAANDAAHKVCRDHEDQRRAHYSVTALINFDRPQEVAAAAALRASAELARAVRVYNEQDPNVAELRSFVREELERALADFEAALAPPTLACASEFKAHAAALLSYASAPSAPAIILRVACSWRAVSEAIELLTAARKSSGLPRLPRILPLSAIGYAPAVPQNASECVRLLAPRPQSDPPGHTDDRAARVIEDQIAVHDAAVELERLERRERAS